MAATSPTCPTDGFRAASGTDNEGTAIGMKAGIFTYAWDLDAEGYERVAGRLADGGFTAINLATSYHAGKFLLPHNPKRRVHFAENGAVYFQPDLSRYGRLRPRVSSLVSAVGEPVARLEHAARHHGLDYVAWMVLLHNSWLGEGHREITMHTAFGDPLIHSLCPAHPDVREYILALIRDLVSRHKVAAIQLESPGYMPFTHGYHHEIVGVALDEVQERLLGISFNPVEIAGATATGIDVEGLRQRIAGLLDACWNQGVPLWEGDGPSAAASAVLEDPEMAAYQGWQQDQVVSLSRQIREVVAQVSPATEIRHFAGAIVDAPGSEPERDLLDTGDAILTGYATSDADARARAAAAITTGKPVWGMVRAIAPDTTDPAEVGLRIATWRESGVDGIDVYNYGLMTQPMLDAVMRSLAS
jgi:hypothetical protein